MTNPKPKKKEWEIVFKIGDQVKIIAIGVVGKIIRIGDDQHGRGYLYKIGGYEEMWFRPEELEEEE